MNLCVIPSAYPGSEFVVQLVNAFTLQGVDCTIITPINTYWTRRNALPEQETIVTPYGKKVQVYRPRYCDRNMPFLPVSTTGFKAQRAVEQIIKDNNLLFDAIYCHFFANALHGWHYAYQNRLPFFVATGESSIRTKFQKPCFPFSWEKFRETTNGVICVSTKNLEECVRLGYADRKKCQVFPNGADLNFFKKTDSSQIKEKLHIQTSDFVIITVGEISQRKGQNRIMQALDLLDNPRIKWIIIGEGENLPERDYVIFKGRIPHDEIPGYLNASDVFVLPTLREGCCNAIVEAMACGLPIVSSDLPFNYDILNDGNSVLVDPNNVSEISNAIDSLYKDRDLLDSKAKNAYQDAQNLSIVMRARNIMDFMQNNM